MIAYLTIQPPRPSRAILMHASKSETSRRTLAISLLLVQWGAEANGDQWEASRIVTSGENAGEGKRAVRKKGGGAKNVGVAYAKMWARKKCGRDISQKRGRGICKKWGGGIWGRGMCEQSLSLASSCRSLVRASHRSLR